jgi:hypothetical protein
LISWNIVIKKIDFMTIIFIWQKNNLAESMPNVSDIWRLAKHLAWLFSRIWRRIWLFPTFKPKREHSITEREKSNTVGAGYTRQS